MFIYSLISDIGLPFYRGLQSYMNGLEHSANYFGTVVKIIKQVMKEAHLIDKLHNNMEFMHSDFKAISQEVDTIYLTEKEIQKIVDTEIGADFIEKFYPRTYPTTAKNVKEICKYAGIDEPVEVRESIGGKTVVNAYPS